MCSQKHPLHFLEQLLCCKPSTCTHLRKVTTGIDESRTAEARSPAKAGKHARTSPTCATVKSIFTTLTTSATQYEQQLIQHNN